MAISHKDHDHPNTPAARAKCRKASGLNVKGTNVTVDRLTGDKTVVKSGQMTVVPRRRGDGGVVQGLKNSKRPNTHLRADHDLADVPRMLAYGCRLAWAADLDVLVGDRFDDEEARIVIKADKGEISLVWRDKRPDGIWKIWVRNYDSSKQYTVESVQEALEIMAFDSKAWDEFGNPTLP